MSSEITLLLTRGFGVQSINTSFDAEFASRPAQAECARGGPRPKKYEGVPLPRPPRGLPQAPHRGFGAELKLVRGWNLTLWSGVAAPPRALCELHSGPHVKKIVLRLRSRKGRFRKSG